jgi:hypothetical protein
MATLRFHWDFMGRDAEPTAKHFCIHLEEFCDKHEIEDRRTYTTPAQGRYVATMECDEKHLVLVRDHLRPKRAERLD